MLSGFSGKEQGDIHAFDLKSQTWQQLETSGETPSPRSVLGVTSFSDRYIVAFGGEVRPGQKAPQPIPYLRQSADGPTSPSASLFAL